MSVSHCRSKIFRNSGTLKKWGWHLWSAIGKVSEIDKINRIIEKAAVLKIETLSVRRWKKEEMLRQICWILYNYTAGLYFEDYSLNLVLYGDYIACNLL